MNIEMGEFIVTILETSDVHGCILPINYADNKLNEVGFAKISTLISQERQNNKNVILIDNGDVLQGTPLTYYYSRIDSAGTNPIISVLNYLKYDAAVIGNHEFNYGKGILEGAIEASNFPWLSANIVDEISKSPLYGKPYLMKEYENGLRVAVLGLTTSYIPNWENPKYIEGIEFLDVVSCAEKWVKFLKEKEMVDIIVVSYHGGFERNLDTDEATGSLTKENVGYELCMTVPGIDVLLTGHQHRCIKDKKINGVIILQPGHDGRNLGKVTLTLKFNDKWIIEDSKSELLSSAGIEADNSVIEHIKDYEEKTQVWLDKPIGKIKGDMVVSNAMMIRLKDNPFIEFVNKVQMDISGAHISNTALFDDNSKGLRSDVTMRDIVSNYIYPNTLRVIRVSGKDIMDALEKSAAYFETYNICHGTEIKVNKDYFAPKPYNYDMWEGIEYIINISRPIGDRIVLLKHKGENIRMDMEFDVVMNNYRAGGGGEYLMFKNKLVIKEITTDVSELIANYILERGTVEASVNNNWKVIYC